MNDSVQDRTAFVKAIQKIEQAYMIACRSTDHLGVAVNKGEEQTQEEFLQRLIYAQGDLESALLIVKDAKELLAAGQ